MSGGPAVDELDGGDGFDRVLARDGRADRIDCGPGIDRVFADDEDPKHRSCERSSLTFALGVAPLARTTDEDGAAPVRVTCPAQSAHRCVGAVRLVTVRRVRTTTGRLRTAMLAAAKLHLVAGTSTDIKLVLDQRARSIVRRLGTATRVRAIVRGRDEAGAARPGAARFILRR